MVRMVGLELNFWVTFKITELSMILSIILFWCILLNEEGFEVTSD